MDTGRVLESIRTMITFSYIKLPLILIPFIGLLAAGLANLGLFLLFLGHVFIVPLATYLIHIFIQYGIRPEIDGQLYIRESIPLVGREAAIAPMPIPTYWMMHYVFLVSYIFTNAYSIQNLPTDPDMDKIIVSNRKNKTMMIMVMLVLVSIIFIFLKGGETPVGIVVACTLGGLLGVGWYKFAAICGARAADIFGIVQQVIPASAKDEKPMTCVYAPKP
jgi:hypothetical protein